MLHATAFLAIRRHKTVAIVCLWFMDLKERNTPLKKLELGPQTSARASMQRCRPRSVSSEYKHGDHQHKGRGKTRTERIEVAELPDANNSHTVDQCCHEQTKRVFGIRH